MSIACSTYYLTYQPHVSSSAWAPCSVQLRSCDARKFAGTSHRQPLRLEEQACIGQGLFV